MNIIDSCPVCLNEENALRKLNGCDHPICTDCEKVFEFCDPRIMQIQNMAEEMLNFDVYHHSLNFFANIPYNLLLTFKTVWF